jgi:hypothetical protein
LSSLNDFGIAGLAGAAEKKSFELREDVVFVVAERPAFFMSLWTD